MVLRRAIQAYLDTKAIPHGLKVPLALSLIFGAVGYPIFFGAKEKEGHAYLSSDKPAAFRNETQRDADEERSKDKALSPEESAQLLESVRQAALIIAEQGKPYADPLDALQGGAGSGR